LVALAAPGARAQDPPAPPQRAALPAHVTFRLADGVLVRGELRAWDERGIDGSFGRRDWNHLMLGDARRLLLRLLDTQMASEWVLMGSILLGLDGGGDLAERAFARALVIDPAAQAAVDRARAEAAARRQEQEERRRAIEAERLRTLPPEAIEWPATPWAARPAEAQRAAEETMRAEATRMLERAGFALEPVETQRFLVYSDAPRRDTATWAVRLEGLYRRWAGVMALDENDSVLWGRAVVFIFSRPEDHRLLEAQAFGQLVPSSVEGIGHQDGPKVFINVHRNPDDHRFAATLMHEAVHGFMHRYRAPRRLPPWANEGLAEYVTALAAPDSIVETQRRRRGIEFIRAGGNLGAILDAGYDAGAWANSDAIGPATGRLLVELMLRDRPQRFRAWVDAVKSGKGWEDALREDFGVTRDELVGVCGQWYRVND
jgi:hypothetical protein